MTSFLGKVALITGASRGIGRAIALELAMAGAFVVINYNKNKEAAEETLKLVKDVGGSGIIVLGDVSQYEEAKSIVQDAINYFGKIDFLINNAGVSSIGLFIDMEESEWNHIIDINVKGVINTSHLVAKEMLKRKNGAIINISSVWGNCGASCEVIYSATKGAVNSFTKALAKELGPSNIRVNAIAPGVIDTEMNSWLCEEEMEKLVQEIPLMRLGKGHDIGKLVKFLLSEESRYITAQVITIDGGLL